MIENCTIFKKYVHVLIISRRTGFEPGVEEGNCNRGSMGDCSRRVNLKNSAGPALHKQLSTQDSSGFKPCSVINTNMLFMIMRFCGL